MNKDAMRTFNICVGYTWWWMNVYEVEAGIILSPFMETMRLVILLGFQPLYSSHIPL